MKNYAVLEGMKRHQKTVLDDAFNKGYDQGYQDGKLDGEAENIEKLEKSLDAEKEAEYQRGYEQGRKSTITIKDFEEYYHTGFKHGQELRVKEAECAEACGMKRAWEAARKLMLSPAEGGIDSGTVKEIFSMNYYAVLKNLPVDEVISKIDAWEKKQERYCYNCGQPRDYKNSCIPYKEGKCEKSHKAWTPKQDAPDIRFGSIEVGDEVVDNLGNAMMVTYIAVESKCADVLKSDGITDQMPLEILEKTGKHYDIQALLDAMKSEKTEEGGE